MPDTKPLGTWVGANVVGMLLVAFEDGKLHWSEHEAVVEAMRALGDHVSAEQTLTFLDETAHFIEAMPQANRADFFRPLASQPPDMKILLLGLVTRVAFADGHLSVEESKLIHKIADWIEIDRKSRATWKRDVHTALDGARQRGSTYTGVENLDLW